MDDRARAPRRGRRRAPRRAPATSPSKATARLAELGEQVAPDEPVGAGDEDRSYRSAVRPLVVADLALEQGKALGEDPVLIRELRDDRRVVQEHDQDE